MYKIEDTKYSHLVMMMKHRPTNSNHQLNRETPPSAKPEYGAIRNNMQRS